MKVKDCWENSEKTTEIFKQTKKKFYELNQLK